MSTTSSKKPVHQQQAGYASTNPFARALAESEQFSYDNNSSFPSFPQNDLSSFGNALSKTGSSMSDSVPSNNFDYMKQQQEEQERLRKREQLRRTLHDRVNPVKENLFSAQEKKVKEELEKTRKELAMLAKDIAKLRQDVNIAVFQEVVEPGTQGTYYISFFQQLRTWILLLRQKIHSARTWATQLNSKSSKKKGKRGSAMSLDGKAGHEQTKTVFDMMHHEVSNARSGG